MLTVETFAHRTVGHGPTANVIAPWEKETKRCKQTDKQTNKQKRGVITLPSSRPTPSWCHTLDVTHMTHVTPFEKFQPPFCLPLKVRIFWVIFVIRVPFKPSSVFSPHNHSTGSLTIPSGYRIFLCLFQAMDVNKRGSGRGSSLCVESVAIQYSDNSTNDLEFVPISSPAINCQVLPRFLALSEWMHFGARVP